MNSHLWIRGLNYELLMRVQEMFKHQLKVAPLADQMGKFKSEPETKHFIGSKEIRNQPTKADYISYVWLVDVRCCEARRQARKGPLVAFARGMLDSSIKFVGVIARTPQP